jgi:hypothetical protein
MTMTRPILPPPCPLCGGPLGYHDWNCKHGPGGLAASARAQERRAAAMSAGDEVIQVVVPPALQAPLREWLASRGLYLFRIPVEDDLPTFGIGLPSEEEQR